MSDPGQRPLRIAWLGPAPDDTTGGVPTAGGILVQQLAAAGAQVDLFTVGDPRDLPDRVRQAPGLTVVPAARRWRWDRWYSRAEVNVLTTLSEQVTRAAAQRALLAQVAERHAGRPYDVLYQWSQWELLTARRLLGRLPPVVLHPQVHAAGELRWHRAERRLVSGHEPLLRTAVVRATLNARAALQRRDARFPSRVVVASEAFAAELQRDYRIPRAQMAVVPNPVDLLRFRPGAAPTQDVPTVLFVGRLSVRKGVEQVVALSHRLADLRVRVLVVGRPSQWSDYRGLLRGLHPAVGAFHGEATPEELAMLYRQAVLTLVPSHYEPFGLTAAESLASGTPVVGTTAVGALEQVDPLAASRVVPGDLDALEAAVRERLADGGPAARKLARSEAERCFAPERVGGLLHAALAEVAG